MDYKYNFEENDLKIAKFTVNGNPVGILNFKGNFTLANIREIARDYQKTLKEEGIQGEISINALFPDRKGNAAVWNKLTRFVDIEEGNLMLDENEMLEDYYGKHPNLFLPERFKIFQLLIATKGKPEGGNDIFNDCLYNCLIKIIPEEMKGAYPTPQHLKGWCKLKREDPIPIEKIPKIEERLKDYKINVVGDYTFTSSKVAKKTITLLLRYGHYEIYLKKLNIAKGVAFKERTPIIYKTLDDPTKVKIYMHEYGYTKVSFDQFKEEKTNYLTSPYVLIRKHPELTMKETYENFIEKATFIKEKTKGKYNYFKSGIPLLAALNRFYELNRTLIADEIDPVEGEWIRKASSSALIWCKMNYQGEGHSYDINSQYPTILSDFHFVFPIKKGTYKTITQKEFKKLKFFEYGIYRCKVLNYDHRLFKRNLNGYYTQFCLTRAKELGYEIQMIEDGKPNLLSYSGAGMKVNGSSAFGQYVEELYQLKNKYPEKKGYFKELLNIIWGALCQKKKIVKIASDDEPINIEGTIVSACPMEAKEDSFYYKIKSIPVGNGYRTPFARLAPFLLARSRTLISKIIEPYIGNVVRVHTDGFISTTELNFKKKNKLKIDYIKIGTELGDLKYEGHEKWIHIKNVNKIVRKDDTKAFK